jgi:hypothetical protein
MDLMQRINVNKTAAHHYVIEQSRNKIAFENKVLIDRILSINKGKYVIFCPQNFLPIKVSNLLGKFAHWHCLIEY